MIEMIFKERKGAEWKRFFVKTKADIHSIDFCYPVWEKEIELVPVTKKLYLLTYLFFNLPKEVEKVKKVNFQTVIDAIPEEIIKDVTAVELFYIFNNDNPWHMSLFEEEKHDTSIFWVALLTEKDTGNDLPSIKPNAEDILKVMPIGVTEKELNAIFTEFNIK